MVSGKRLCVAKLQLATLEYTMQSSFGIKCGVPVRATHILFVDALRTASIFWL